MTALRADYRQIALKRGDRRAPERLIAHYTLERRLTDRLKAAPREERSRVYTEVYTELFDSLSDHPQMTGKRDSNSERVAWHLTTLARHLKPNARYLEIGCGDAAVAFGAAERVERAFGLDVTERLVPASRPANFTFLKTDGVHIPLPDASVDVVYSDQLMEHLHPDDAEAQLREIRRVLAPGGVYHCSTPSRFTGPHDISAYFDFAATGLHLREYDYRSLRHLFHESGFKRCQFVVTVKGRHLPMPYWLGMGAEVVLSMLPGYARAAIMRLPLASKFMGLTALGS